MSEKYDIKIVSKIKLSLEFNRSLQKLILNEAMSLGSLILTLTKANDVNKSKSCFNLRLVPLFKKIDDNHDSLYYPYKIDDTSQKEKWSKSDISKLKKAIEQYSKFKHLLINPSVQKRKTKLMQKSDKIINSDTKSVNDKVIDNKDVESNDDKSHDSEYTNKNEKQKYLSKNNIDNYNAQNNIESKNNINTEFIYNGIDFKYISRVYVKSHTPTQCLLYYKNRLKVSPKDEVWSKEDEKKLITLAKKFELRNWETISIELDRTAITCLMHYMKVFYVPDNELNEDELLEHRWLSKQFTEEEDDKIRQLAPTLIQGSWAPVCHLFPSRTHLSLKRRHALLVERDLQNDWNKEKDLKLIKYYQLYGDNFDFISKMMGNISSSRCKQRFLILQKNQINNVWKVGLKSDKRKSYELKDNIDESLTKDSVSIKPSKDFKSCFPPDFVEYKRLYSIEMMKIKKKKKDILQRKTEIEQWKLTIKYLHYCILKLKKCLSPDLKTSDWKFRYVILQEFAKLPKKNIFYLKECINNSTDNLYCDDFGIKFINSSQSDSYSFNQETDPSLIVFILFGNLLFDIVHIQNSYVDLINNNIHKITNESSKTVLTAELLAKNEALLQKTDLSKFKIRKRRK